MADGLLIDQLRLIGKSALWFAIALFCCFLFFLTLSDIPLSSYREASDHLYRSQEDLPWMMLLGGLLLLMTTALTLWLSCLFMTHRAAGPLYRFSRNLEGALTQGSLPRQGIRRGDLFQEESAHLLHTADQLSSYEHHLVSGCRKLIGEMGTLNKNPAHQDDPGVAQRLNVTLQQLKSTASRGHIDAHPQR